MKIKTKTHRVTAGGAGWRSTAGAELSAGTLLEGGLGGEPLPAERWFSPPARRVQRERGDGDEMSLTPPLRAGWGDDARRRCRDGGGLPSWWYPPACRLQPGMPAPAALGDALAHGGFSPTLRLSPWTPGLGSSPLGPKPAGSTTAPCDAGVAQTSWLGPWGAEGHPKTTILQFPPIWGQLAQIYVSSTCRDQKPPRELRIKLAPLPAWVFFRSKAT